IEDTVAGGALIGLGADVAVLHLAQPVVGVTPFTYGAFDPNTLGTRYPVVGFGIQDNNEVSLFRNAGTETLIGTTGRDWEALFGSFDESVRQPPRITDPDLRNKSRDELRTIFDSDVLLQDYEAHFGGRPGDSVTCHGDSGGPTLVRRNGRLAVV